MELQDAQNDYNNYEEQLLQNNLTNLNNLLQQKEGELVERQDINFNISSNSPSNQNSATNEHMRNVSNGEKQSISSNVFAKLQKSMNISTNHYASIGSKMDSSIPEVISPSAQDSSGNFDYLAARLKEAYEKRIKILEDEKASLEDEVESVTKNWSISKGEANKVLDTVNKVNQENGRLVTKITALNSEVSKLTNERLELEGNVNYLSHQRDGLADERIKRQESDKLQIRTEIEAKNLEKELLITKEKLHKEKVSRSYYEEESAILKDKLQEMEANYNMTIKEKIYAEEMVKHLDDDLKLKDSKLENLKSNNKNQAHYLKEFEELKISYDTLDLENRQFNVRNEELSKSLAQTNNDLTQEKIVNCDFQDELLKCKEKIESLMELNNAYYKSQQANAEDHKLEELRIKEDQTHIELKLHEVISEKDHWKKSDNFNSRKLQEFEKEFQSIETEKESLQKKIEMQQNELIESEGKRGHIENLFGELAKEAEQLEMKVKQQEASDENNMLALEVEGLGKAIRAYEILLDEVVRKLKSSSLPLELFADNEDIEVPLLDNFDDNQKREEFLRKLCIFEQCLKNLVEYSESFNAERDVWRDKIKVFEEELGYLERNNEKQEKELQIEVESKSHLRQKLNTKLDNRCSNAFQEKQHNSLEYLDNNDDLSKFEHIFQENQKYLTEVIKTLMMALISNDRLEELLDLNSKYFEQKIESFRQEKSLQKNECMASTLNDDKDRKVFYKEINMQKDDLKNAQNQTDFLYRRQRVLQGELKAQIAIENEEIEKLKQGVDEMNNNLTIEGLKTDENTESDEYAMQNRNNVRYYNQQNNYHGENTEISNENMEQYYSGYNSHAPNKAKMDSNFIRVNNQDRGLQSTGKKSQTKLQFVSTDINSQIKEMMKEDQEQIKNTLNKIKNKIYHY